jgi:hypothetical protein
MSFFAALTITIGCDPGPSGSPTMPTARQARAERALPDEAGDRYAVDVELTDEARPGREALAKRILAGRCLCRGEPQWVEMGNADGVDMLRV